MRVLITRPSDDSASLADALRRVGIDVISEPLLAIRPVEGAALDLADVQAFLLTSANGARAIAHKTDRRDLPVYAVGDATARIAREAGFTDVHSADSDVEALAALVRTRLDPAMGALLHAAGSEVAGDLGGRLGEAGFSYRRAVVYEAEAANSFSPSAIAAIKEGRIDAVLVYSPRTAETLGRLIRKARLVRDCRAIELLCLSQAVADAAADISWKARLIADSPTQDAMVTLAAERAQAPAAQPAVPSPASAPPDRPRAGGAMHAVLMTLLVVAALAGIAAVSAPWWRPELARFLPVLAEYETASARIDTLAQRLAAVEAKSSAPAGPSASDFAALQAERERLQARLGETIARLDALEAAVASLREQATKARDSGDDVAAREALKQLAERLAEIERTRAGADADASGRIERLARQLETLEKNVPPREDVEAVRQARLVFAIGRLRDAVLSSRPFTIELAALKALAGDNPGIGQALQRLDPHADSGVPSLEALRQRFKTVARDTVNASRMPEVDGWLERALARVMRAVNVRRTDDLEGSDVEAIVARAERALDRADVRQAANELQQLPEGIAPLARRWRDDADAFATANRALVDLQSKAFATLGVERGK